MTKYIIITILLVAIDIFIAFNVDKLSWLYTITGFCFLKVVHDIKKYDVDD